jgi:hypothetical protein
MVSIALFPSDVTLLAMDYIPVEMDFEDVIAVTM